MTEQALPTSADTAADAAPDKPTKGSLTFRSDAPTHRRKLRAYLTMLFEELGRPLPEAWPDVPGEVFYEYFGSLRQQIDRLMEHIATREDLEWRQKKWARFFPETVLHLLRADWQSPPEWFEQASESTEEVLSRRPPPIVQYDQLYCTPDSTERRAHKIIQAFNEREGRVLFLGDDDLGSVILAPHFDGEVHVIDLDDRLLRFIEEQDMGIQTHSFDLIQRGVPASFYESFDAVVLDPPWDYHGTWSFLNKAIYCLKDHRRARIFLSFCPLQLELERNHMARFLKRLSKLGMTCEAIVNSFNLYDLIPIDTPEYDTLIDYYILKLDSPLMDLLQQAPYAYAHLYELRRLEGVRPSALGRAWFKWWHTA